VRHLPHQLVEAFRSTLEEVGEADLVLHVVDGSHPDPLGQLAAVREVLAEIEAEHVPELVVVNKADVSDSETLARIRRAEPDAVAVSALTGAGLDELRARIAERLPKDVEVTLLVPYDRGDVLARMHAHGRVASVEHTDVGSRVVAALPAPLAAELAVFG
jgi:GTPase